MKSHALALPSLLLAACGGSPPVAPATPPPAPASNVSTSAPLAPAAPVLDEDFLRAYTQSRFFTRGAPRDATLTPDGRTVLFLRSGARDSKQSLFEMDVATGAAHELLAPEALAGGPERLTLEERARRERMRITASGFTSYLLSKDGRTVVLSLSGNLYALDRTSGKSHRIDVGKGGAAIDPRLSPDGKLLAYVQDDDLHVSSVDGAGKPRALTRGGTETMSHGLADFCASEELDRHRGFFWSPDSTAILYEEADGSKLEKLAIVDPGHPENPPDVVPYPRAGHANAVVRFGVVKVGAPGQTTWIEWDREKMPYVAQVTWDDHAPPTLVALDRLQKNASVLLVDPATGKAREAMHEHDEAWVNIDPSVPAWLPDGSGFLWMGERDGDRRYGLVPANGGDVKWLTPAGMQAEAVADVDAEKRALVFDGTRDGLHRETMRVSLDGGPVTTLARLDGGTVTAHFSGHVHDAFLLREESLTAPPRVLVRSLDGTKERELPSLAERPAKPSVELTAVGPDATKVALVRPRAYVPGVRYPVIDAAYGGPHHQVVSAAGSAYYLAQWIADATGAIVAFIDAKGTPGRGRAWERAILGKLADIPLDGHVAALEALAAAHPEIDGARVGVYGWSFGGYFASLAALRRPDVFAVGVAIAPVADWRDYDTAYTERYLGLPQEAVAAYDASSVLTYAALPPAGRQAALLIAHGTADDNVYFLNALKLVDTLAKAGRTFRFTPFIGQTHQFASQDALFAVYRELAETFQRALSAPTPEQARR
jgi:dipeptidyl-peptidase-4